MIAERILMGLLLGGVAIGCVLVLVSVPIGAALGRDPGVTPHGRCFEWLRVHLHLRRMWAAVLMVTLTAVVLVLPIGVAAPGSADDVTHLRHAIMDGLRAGLPDSPAWVFDIPLVGTIIGDLWNRWAADISVMLEALRPYFGIVLEDGLSLLLGIANGVLMFLLALFVAVFFYIYGEPIAARMASASSPYRRDTGRPADHRNRRDGTWRGLWHPRNGGGAGHPDSDWPVDFWCPTAGTFGQRGGPIGRTADWVRHWCGYQRRFGC